MQIILIFEFYIIQVKMCGKVKRVKSKRVKHKKGFDASSNKVCKSFQIIIIFHIRTKTREWIEIYSLDELFQVVIVL